MIRRPPPPTSRHLRRLRRYDRAPSNEGDKLLVNAEDLIFDYDELKDDGKQPDWPYLKCIELMKCQPQHFGLEKWEPHFLIPDQWMKRIYKKDVYKDTDLPSPEHEQINPYQLDALHQWIDECKRQTAVLEPAPTGQRVTRIRPPEDDLIDLVELPCEPPAVMSPSLPLDEQDSIARWRIGENRPLCDINSDNLAICLNHKVQPEEVIVRMALQKMKFLSEEEEHKYQELLKDREFLDLLDSYVEKYVTVDVDVVEL